MATKASGGGAQLASGYISLSVKYASAMGQIADDFDAIDKKAKSTGESITKNLVAGADKAKAQVAELGTAYEAQRAKVAALKDTLAQLQAQQAKANEAEKAYNAAFRSDREKRKAYIQEEIRLNEALNQARAKARSSGVAKEAIDNSAGVKAVQAQIAANDAQRKTDLQTLTRLEKELAAARSAAGTDSTKVQETLNAELAKGKEMFEQYGKAVEDAARKQQLAATSGAALTNSMGAAAQHLSFGQRMARLIAGPFAPELQSAGTKAGNAFRRAFNHQMDTARGESEHHARSLANGLLMGMTPGVMGAAGVGLALGKAFSMGFERNEVIETTKLRLQALGKTSQEISAVTDTALKSVQGTQYSLAEAIDAASGAMLGGIALGPQMTQYMDNIANAAALTGVEYGQVADAMGRVQRQGTVSLENIEPLTNKGLPVLDWLTDYYKKQFPSTTKADITDMISKKLIPADVLQQVMTAHLSNSMKDIGKKTVKGAFTDLMTQVGKVTGSILEPVMGEGGIPAFLNRIGARLSTFSEYIKPGMAAAVKWVRTTWASLSDWFTTKWAEWWPKVKPVIDKFVSMWKDMWPQLAAHLQPFLAAVKRLWDAAFPILKGIGAVAAWIAYEFIKHMPAIAQFATNLVNWLATAVDWLRTKFWPWFKESWKHFVEDIVGAWHKAVEFKDKVVDAFEKIKSGTLGVWNWLEDKFNWLVDKITWIKDNAHWLTDPFGSLANMFTGSDGNSYNIANTSSSTPLVGGIPSNVPMPAGLIDVEGKHSGPQARYVAGLIMSMFGIDHVAGARATDTAPNTHDTGTSIDIPIGPSAAERAKGDQIEKFLQENAKQLGIVYTIWKDVGKQTGLGGRSVGTFNQPGHQNHIDVHFDGVTYGATGSDGNTYSIAPSAASKPLGAQDSQLAAALKAQGFTDSQITGLIALNGVETGNWSHPESIMGFTNQQTGPGISAHVAGFKEMWDRRQRTGAVGAVGTAESGMDANGNVVDPTKFANWLLKLEGYSATQDWQGNQYAPGQFLSSNAYASKVIGAYGPKPVSIPVALMDSSRPMVPGDPGYRPPQTLPEALLGNVQSAAVGPGTIAGIPMPGLANQPPNAADILNASSPGSGKTWYSTGSTPTSLMTPEQQERLRTTGGGEPAPDNWFQKFIQNDPLMPQVVKDLFNPNHVFQILPDLPESWGGLPNMDSGAGRTAANQYAHRGIQGPMATTPKDNGPKGTKDDPIVTTDPQVADNTDPKNQPGAPDGPPLTPDAGGGLGNSAGKGITGTDANGNPVGPDGKPIEDLTSGLGDVASKAFSDQFAGTPFSDPTTWPMTQSAGALLQFFGGLLRGQGGSGLGGLFGPGGKAATPKQTRDMNRRVREAGEAVSRAQAKVDSMVGKPQYTAEERAQAQQDLDDALQNQSDVAADAQELGAKGVFQNPFGQFNIGTPPASPGGDVNGGAVAPGGGWAGASLPTGLIPKPSDVQPAPAAPAGPQVTVDNSIHQEIAGDPASARDQAARAVNTNNAAAVNTIKLIPGAQSI